MSPVRAQISLHIAPENMGIYINIAFFFFHENHAMGTHQKCLFKASNQDPQQMFSWRNKKNMSIEILKKCILPEGNSNEYPQDIF